MQFTLHSKDNEHILLYDKLLEDFKNSNQEAAYNAM